MEILFEILKILADGIAFISLLSTRHLQKTNTSGGAGFCSSTVGKAYTPSREKKSFVKKLRVSKSEFLNFFPESQSEFLNFGCLLPRQVVRNAPECNLRNYQTLDWAEKNKKFQSLSRQSVFLMIGPGCIYIYTYVFFEFLHAKPCRII